MFNDDTDADYVLMKASGDADDGFWVAKGSFQFNKYEHSYICEIRTSSSNSAKLIFYNLTLKTVITKASWVRIRELTPHIHSAYNTSHP